jgi:hypothetical protein
MDAVKIMYPDTLFVPPDVVTWNPSIFYFSKRPFGMSQDDFQISMDNCWNRAYATNKPDIPLGIIVVLINVESTSTNYNYKMATYKFKTIMSEKLLELAVKMLFENQNVGAPSERLIPTEKFVLGAHIYGLQPKILMAERRT